MTLGTSRPQGLRALSARLHVWQFPDLFSFYEMARTSLATGGRTDRGPCRGRMDAPAGMGWMYGQDLSRAPGPVLVAQWKRQVQAEQGAVLILALFSVVLIATLVIGLLNVGRIEQQIATNHIYDMRSTFIADAGIETGVYELRQDNTYTGTGGDVTFPSGSGNTYNVVVSGGSIASTGTVGDFSRKISATYTLTGSSAPYTVVLDTWVEQ